MPLPFILGGIAIATGLAGLAGFLRRSSTQRRSWEEALAALEQQRLLTREVLDDLGRWKLKRWEAQIIRFHLLYGGLESAEPVSLQLPKSEQLGTLRSLAREPQHRLEFLGLAGLEGLIFEEDLKGRLEHNFNLLWLSGDAGLSEVKILGGLLSREIPEAQDLDQLNRAITALKGIQIMAKELKAELQRFAEGLEPLFYSFENAVMAAGSDFRFYSIPRRQAVERCLAGVQSLYALLLLPWLSEEGGLRAETPRALRKIRASGEQIFQKEQA